MSASWSRPVGVQPLRGSPLAFFGFQFDFSDPLHGKFGFFLGYSFKYCRIYGWPHHRKAFLSLRLVRVRQAYRGRQRVYFRPDGVMANAPYHLMKTSRTGLSGFACTMKGRQMKIPVWLKPAIWGAVAGAAIMAITGFSQLGWTTSATAEKIAQERAGAAVVSALVPFCVAKAELDPDRTVFTKLQTEAAWYTRSDMVAKAGWATVGDEKVPDSALARACADKLTRAKSG